jgi:hypothetical protein
MNLGRGEKTHQSKHLTEVERVLNFDGLTLLLVERRK